MKKLYQYIKNFLKEDFHPGAYASVFAFLGITVFLNYHFGWEDAVEEKYKYTETRFLIYFLLFAFPYYFTVFIVWLFKRTDVFSNTKFWTRSVLALALMSLDKCFYYHIYFYEVSNWEIKHFVYRVTSNLKSILTVFIPVLLFYYSSGDYRERNFYGFRKEGFDIKPYLVMLAIMIPILYIASTTEDFTEYYPKYERVDGPRVAKYYDINEWPVAVAFELAYSWDFVMVELLMRGLFVVGMIKVIGKHAVLPMAAAYCFYHFGKPMGETYSSIFGGYVLGVFAYYTRSIWGGVFVHLGIALLMELFAYIQNLLKQ